MVDASVSIRNAVRPFLAQLEAGDTFLVAVSGGADSLALAAALFIEAKPLALMQNLQWQKFIDSLKNQKLPQIFI